VIIGGVMMVIAMIMLVASGESGSSGAILFMIGLIVAAPGLVMPAARLFSPLLTLWYAREGDLARGNLTRQPGRAAITASTLMIGLATLILMAAMVSGFDQYLQGMVTKNFSSDIVLMPQSISLYNNVIGADESLTERLYELPEVQTVTGMRYASTLFNGQLLQVFGIDPQLYTQVAPLDFVEGQPEEAYAALTGERTLIANSLTVKTLGVSLGSSVTLQTVEGEQTYRVVGIANDMLSFKLNAVFISQENLKTDFHKAEDIMVMVNLKSGADTNAAFAAINTITEDYPQFTANITGEYRDQLLALTAGGMSFFYVLGLLILIPAALGLLNTLTINVLERTREIGIIRAVGGSHGQIRRMVTAEALLLGLFGAATGVLAGVAMSYGFIAAFSLIGWNLPYIFPVMGIIAAVVIGILLALFASILPARNAAKLDIIRAIQYE
jgi:putative ABC transport system permease protein